MKPMIILIVTLSVVQAFCQGSQAEYLELKRQFQLGNYKTAQNGFKELANDPSFGPYASFYFALSSYRMGQTTLATDMWKQILTKFPNWESNQEVILWLSYALFEDNEYAQAFKYADQLQTNLRASLIATKLSSLETHRLREVLDAYPEKEIAGYLFEMLNELPYDQRDQELIMDLMKNYDLDPSLGKQGVFKERYAIAIVLPFMYEGMDNPNTVLKNAIILELYEGMKLAKKELDSMGVFLELFPFDTKKNKSETTRLVSSHNLKNADLIIGPLYAEPNEVIQSFSSESGIPVFNPLSSNSEVMDVNPNGYLFHPSYETMGASAARYAAVRFRNNKKAFIFFENERDLIIASNYKNVLENEGYEVLRFDRLTNEDAQQLQEDFTEQYEYLYDSTEISPEVLDSINAIPGRYVRSRSKRDTKTGRIITNNEGEEIKEFYEMKFTIGPDSIGHIFAATSSNLLANNFISLAEVRTDSIGVIGYDDWLKFSLVNYDQLERIKVSMIGSGFYDKSTIDYKKLRKKFIKNIGSEPSKYHIIGYELIHQVGRLFQKYGTDIQNGLVSETVLEGIIMEDFFYGPFHDNQAVPILQLEDLKLVNKNPIQKVD